MKHLLFLIIFLLTSVAFSVDAEADIFMKYGRLMNDSDDQRSFAGIWFEQSNCKECISLFGLETQGANGVDNRIAGADYTYKSFQTNDAEIRFSIGYAIAERAINNSENFNFHLGGGFVIKNLIFNKYDLVFFYDHFSNGRTVLSRGHIENNLPLDMISFGIGF